MCNRIKVGLVVGALLGGCGLESEWRPRERDASLDVRDVMVEADADVLDETPSIDVIDVEDTIDVVDVIDAPDECAIGLRRCGETCVDAQTDPTNCGACANACAPRPNAVATCAMGECAFRCNPSFAACDDDAANGCEAALDDAAHCGRCETACAGATPLCAPFGDSFACSSGCATGLARCASTCADLQGDLSHCGACGNVCATRPNAVATCAASVCGLRCNADFANCDGDAMNGCEVNTLSTVAHCGGCGAPCASGPNATATCGAGRCGLLCASGFADCDGTATNGCEVDMRASTSHCGACGNACPSRPNAVATCAAGACAFRCTAGFADCDSAAANGCEVDTLSTVAHCGRCGAPCAAGSNATATCVAARCGLTCEPGFADCDGITGNGCEVDTRASTSHCGTCGNACASRANAVATCTAGACAFRCNAAFADCDGNAANGCEAALDDATHCGRCETTCAGATPLCAPSGDSFACSSGCATGLARCASTCADLQGDLSHCGACGNACPAPSNAARTCTTGTCGFTCNAGFGNCDGVAGTGCEVDVRTATNHCGACGNVCATRPNSVATCAAGVCGLRCNADFANCDGDMMNGCEVNTLSTVAHCGGCGAPCASGPNATATCGAGRCGLLCASGFADCDGTATNGCEVDTRASTSHCGACGNVCSGAINAVATCTTLGCGFRCNAGFADCDGNAANGCEVNTQSSAAHCGACGVLCAARPNADAACASGSCALVCNAGFGDCDGDASNGCERDLRTNTASCGRCGASCTSAQGCFAGVCTTLGRRIGNNGSRGCAIYPGVEGTVWCWGSNASGALADGTSTQRLTPVQALDLVDAVEITVGTVACALRANGTVACWGNNTNGRLGNGSMLTTFIGRPTAVVGLSGAVEVASGGTHSCARLASGSVVCWGSNPYGQLGDGSATNRASPVPVSGLTDAVAISLGGNHSCARRASGAVVCWGENTYGQLGDGTTTHRYTPVTVMGADGAVELDAGTEHACVRRATGRVACWGRNEHGQLGDTTQISRSTPADVTGVTDAVEISAGRIHTCARRPTGAVVCWGYNGSGQLGTGASTPIIGYSPLAVMGLTDAVEIVAGEDTSCARRATGGLICWGDNGLGERGNGLLGGSPAPSPVLLPP